MKNRRWLLAVVALAVALGVAVWLLTARTTVKSVSDVRPPAAPAARTADRPPPKPIAAPPAQPTAEPDGEPMPEEGETEEPEDNSPEAVEEKLVNAFDDLTDQWREPAKAGVTMADADNFLQSFRKVPKPRQDECIHRALNLIPDENVMLLAGVLMDKTMDREIVEAIYGDVLNRDDSVKKPILQEIFKDKSHPCWADTAWILDVTGELPKSK